MKCQEPNITKKNQSSDKYDKDFFEDFSIRDWVVWDREIAYILVFEYDEYMEEIRKTKDL